MKEIRDVLLGQNEKDDKTLNYVSREVQEAVLNSDLSDSIKDKILNEAVGTINQIAERRWVYEAIPRSNADPKQYNQTQFIKQNEGIRTKGNDNR